MSIGARWPAILRLVGVLVLAGLGKPGSASAQESVFSDIEPFLGIRQGIGYDTAAQGPARAGQPCIDFDAGKTYTGSAGTNNNDKTTIKRSVDLVKTMNLSAWAQVKALTGNYEAKSTLEVADKSEVHQFSETKLYYSYRLNDASLLLTEFTAIKPQYQSLLKKGILGLDEFRAKCGNAFVIGQQTGEYYFGTVFKSSKTSSSNFDLKLTGEFSLKSSVLADAYLSYANAVAMKEQEEKEQFSSSTSNQRLTAPRDPAELEKQWAEFVPTGSGAKMVKAVIAPYSVAKGALPEGLLSGNSEQKKLEILLEGLWDLKTLKDAAQFVLRKPDQFALGLWAGPGQSNSPKRGERLEYVRKLHQRWQAEFDKLLGETKACLNAFTPQCAKLANEYESNPRISAESQLPKKYKNFCYAKIEVRQKVDADKETEFALYHKRGDKEMGGGPVRVRAVLTIEPSGTSALLARVSVTAQEDKADHTTYVGSAEQVVFDIQKPFATQENPLEECQLGSAPVLNESRGRSTYGTIDGLSPRNPRKFLPFTSQTGLLKSIACEVDKEGSDEEALKCKAPSIGSFSVALVNRLDVEAEKWTAPFDPADLAMLPAIRGFGRVR